MDSSVVAGLLQRRGQPIVGLTMQLWNQRRLPELAPEGGVTGRCCSLDDVYDARHVAQHLGIPYYVVNFEDRFEEQVVKPFIDDYLAAARPSPARSATTSSSSISFWIWPRASARRASPPATTRASRYDDATGRYQMRRGVDQSKDQTYFLFGLTQEQLARTDFPLGGFTKPQVRELARELGLPVAEKPDSQEICFVPNGDYAAFIDAYFRERGIAPGAHARRDSWTPRATCSASTRASITSPSDSAADCASPPASRST